MEGTKGVPLSSIVKEFKLEVLAQSSQFDQTQIHVTSINRPGLQLMGYYDYFDEKRVQLLGKAEYSYMRTMTTGQRFTFLDSLFSHGTPALIIARDLESKESLRNLRRPAYIIAHKQVLTDLGPLIDRNIGFIHDKGRELLEDLEDGMSFDQWIYAFCQRENVRTRNEFKFSIVERNFANFVDWLTDEGKVEVRREFCAKHYFHRG